MYIPTGKPVGRPPAYTEALAAEICMRLARGESLLQMCKLDHMPARSTIAQWHIDNVEGFSARYTHAREMGLDVLAEEILEISDTTHEGVRTETKGVRVKGACPADDDIVDEDDDGIGPVMGTETKETRADMIEHRKLRVDSRKWYLSKLAPKRFGDKLALEHSGALDMSAALIASRKRMNK
jgi:hypothetical protein